MPEGPEVRIVAEYLHSKCRGWIIDGIDEVDNLSLKGHKPAMYGTIQEVRSLGKAIIFVTDTCILESKLAMEGKWLRFPGHYTKFIMRLHKGMVSTELYYDDMRSFGSLSIHYDYYDISKRIGVDLLQCALDGVTVETLLPSYRSRLAKHSKDITSFLMEQKYFAGVGNYLKAEILYACRIHPSRLASSITEVEAYNLLYYSLDLILRSYRCNGLTIRTYITPTGNKGSFDTNVYGKKYDPYGNPVVTACFDDKRTTHFCPNLQIP